MAAAGAPFEAPDPGLAGRPEYRAGQASALALSPDGRTLLALTSGFNRVFDAEGKVVPEASNEYVFIYDVSSAKPVRLQAIPLTNAFLGIAWAPAGDRFFVSAGVEDKVVEFARAANRYLAGRTFDLGHKAGLGLAVPPGAAGLAVSPDGKRLLVANYQNDSASLIDLTSGIVEVERDLRPGIADPALTGRPGGTFPKAIAWLSNTRTCVASQRDRELIMLDVAAGSLKIVARLKPAVSRSTPHAPGCSPRSTTATPSLSSIHGAGRSPKPFRLPRRRQHGAIRCASAERAATRWRLPPMAGRCWSATAARTQLPSSASVTRRRALAGGRAAARRAMMTMPKSRGSAVVGLIPTG